MSKTVTINFEVYNRLDADETVPSADLVVGFNTTKVKDGIATVTFKPLYEGFYPGFIGGTDFTREEVGPSLGGEGAPDRIWRPLIFLLKIEGLKVTAYTILQKRGHSTWGEIDVSGNLVKIGLQPVWMRAVNQSSREGATLKQIILHNTAANIKDSVRTLFKSSASKVSIHYLIARDGQVIKGVHEGIKSWHAGESEWLDAQDLNRSSVGIEITRKPDVGGIGQILEIQLQAVIGLIRRIIREHKSIKEHTVLGHAEVLKPYTKKPICPGPDFDWERLRTLGLGLGIDLDFHNRARYDLAESFSSETSPLHGLPSSFFEDPNFRLPLGSSGPVIRSVQEDLKYIGYRMIVDGQFGRKVTGYAIQAFCFHFIPGCYTINDDGTVSTIDRYLYLDLDTILTIRAVRSWCEKYRDAPPDE